MPMLELPGEALFYSLSLTQGEGADGFCLFWIYVS